MAKRRKNQNEHLAQRREEVLSAHMQSLECFTVEHYLDWCRARGFRADTRKSLLNILKEQESYKKQNAVEHLLQSRLARNPIDVIAAVCDGKLDPDNISSFPLREVCQRIRIESLAKHERRSLREFLSTIGLVSKLPMQSEIRDRIQLNYMDALLALHRLRRHWLRSIDQWRPKTHNRERQFLSLVRHLLTTYSVPDFLGSVWFRTDAPAPRYQQWYVDIGNGKNPRAGPAPVPLTKKTAHYFLQAPNGYSVEQAVRFAQVKALGGGIELCTAIIESRLGTEFSNDEFWQGVIRFFIRHPELELSQVGPIVDFIHHQKFEGLQVVLGDGETRWLPPPQPNLSMQKRTLRALHAQVDQWHHRLSKVKVESGMRWAASGVRPASFVRAKDNQRITWRINELLSQKDLLREGNALRHCVATYSRACRDGDSSIWSLISEDACGNVRRRQTIQVSRHSEIVQCRGRRNKEPTEQERQIVRLWAKAESLTLRLHGF